MISFACKTVDLKDIIRCGFDLSKTEYALLEFLLRQEDFFGVSELVHRLSLERSTLQKGISGLVAKDLVARRQENLGSGGYRFIYSVADKDSVKRRLRSVVESWHGQVLKAIDEW